MTSRHPALLGFVFFAACCSALAFFWIGVVTVCEWLLT